MNSWLQRIFFLNDSCSKSCIKSSYSYIQPNINDFPNLYMVTNYVKMYLNLWSIQSGMFSYFQDYIIQQPYYFKFTNDTWNFFVETLNNTGQEKVPFTIISTTCSSKLLFVIYYYHFSAFLSEYIHYMYMCVCIYMGK